MHRRVRFLDLWAASTESHEDGIKAQEIEYTFYAKISDMSALKDAYEIEEQEQWLVPIDTDVKGKMRIRRVGDGRFLQCTKIKRPGQEGSEEVEQEITEDMFHHLREMGEGGYKKYRHYFKVPASDLVWEVDVFLAPSGEKHSWVKIDLEVPNLDTKVPDLPFEVDEIITHQGNDLTYEERQFINNLWNKEWVSLDSEQFTKAKEEEE